jgi:hypothetical protein
MTKISFEFLLKNIEKYDNNNILYTKSSPVNLYDEVIVDNDIYDIKDNINGFEYFCGMNQLKSVLRNLSMQNPNYTDLNICIDAINYYIEYDAFIDLENN